MDNKFIMYKKPLDSDIMSYFILLLRKLKEVIMLEKTNLKNIIVFTLPSIAMILFMAFYTMVDGAFVANLINQTALSAINIALPVFILTVAVGLMVGTGGNAICAKLLGEGKTSEAKEMFTLFAIFGAVVGVIILVFVLIFLENILNFLGANEHSRQYVYDYIVTYIVFAPMAILQMIMQTSLITANVPVLAFVSILIGGITNIILDYVFIELFSMGISGAALATGIGNTLGAIIGIVYFSTKRSKRVLSFKLPKFNAGALVKMSINGSSEMVTNLSNAVVTLLFNKTMLNLAGNDGIAAITVVLYLQLFVNSVFMGFSLGVLPIISYNYGARDATNLHKLFRINFKFIICLSVVMLVVAYLIAEPIANFFLDENSNAYNLVTEGLLIFSISFLFAGFNIYASSMYTAYSNGKVSAIISFMRTFVFTITAILILPKLIGIKGVWLAVPIAEASTIVIVSFFLHKYRKAYMYG